MKISEVSIVPIKPQNGLVAFASFVINDGLYCGSVGIMSRPDGSYRLIYPTKLVGSRQLDVFHPIATDVGRAIQRAVINKFEDVVRRDDRHSCPDDTVA